MKLVVSLLLSLTIVTPALAADAIWCVPVEKKVEEKKVEEKKVEEPKSDKPEKKKHRKYEGTKVPDAKK